MDPQNRPMYLQRALNIRKRAPWICKKGLFIFVFGTYHCLEAQYQGPPIEKQKITMDPQSSPINLQKSPKHP